MVVEAFSSPADSSPRASFGPAPAAVLRARLRACAREGRGGLNESAFLAR